MNAQTAQTARNKAFRQTISFLLAATLLAGCANGRFITNSTTALPVLSSPATATSSDTATPPPSPTPTATATPLALPSVKELKARFASDVKPLVDQLLAAPEEASTSLEADVPIIYVPTNERLYTVQSILQIGRPQIAITGKTAYILYDYTRGANLTTGEPWMSTSSPETQEIITNLRLILAENGTFKLIERSKATGGEGSTSTQNLVENAFKPFANQSSSSQSVQTDLEEIIGYACGIDMIPSLDYERKVALMTFALSSDNWAERHQATEALGTLDPIPVSAASALIPLLANDTEDLYPAEQTLSKMAVDPKVLRQLVAALKNPNAHIRQHAASALQGLDPKPAALLKPFMSLLHDKEVSVRQVAESWLSYYGDPAVIPPMITALSDKTAGVRQAAAQVLGEYGAQAAEAVPGLTNLLQDPDADVRAAAARTLGMIGSAAASALPDLNKTASNESDTDAFMSEVGASATLSSKADTIPLLRQALTRDNSNIRGIAPDILSSYQGVPGAIETLTLALQDKDYYVRRNAYSAFEKFGSEAQSVLPTLIQIAQKTTDYREYMDVLAAIGAVSSKVEALPLLKQSLTSSEAGIRRAACGVLSTYQGVPGVEQALTTAIHDTDETVRQCAADALARISSQPDASLTQLIQTAESETDPESFYNEIQSITELSGKAAALPALNQVLIGNNVKIRAKASGILAQYEGIPGAVEALLTPINDSDASVREAAATSLQVFGSEASTALPGLKAAAGSETDRMAFEAQMAAIAAIASPAEAYPLIQNALKLHQSDMRVAATNSLKVCKDVPGAIDLLITLIHDPDERVRGSAVGSIYYYGAAGKKAVPDLITALGNPQDYFVYLGAATTLGGIGPEASPAVPALVHMVQTAGDLEKQYPLEALGKIGPAAREAVPALMQFLNAIPKGNWTNELQKDCLKALNSITQEDFGTDIQKWNAWWALKKNTW